MTENGKEDEVVAKGWKGRDDDEVEEEGNKGQVLQVGSARSI